MLTNSALKYHYHPVKGWLNDPNGLCDFGGLHHVFYQYCPDSETPSVAKWGHAITKDFLNWQELGVAIDTDMPYDANGVWSGTAIVKDGRMYAFYASRDGDKKQAISVAFSDDGIHFEKYAGNPIISEYPPEGSDDFRDPTVMEFDGRYYMLVGSADTRKDSGTLLLYESADLLAWSYSGVFREYPDCFSCECPSFVRMDGGVIVAVSNRPKSGGHYFEVMYGQFDGRRFEPQIVSHFQKGPDEYAGQIYRDEKGRAILISWISGWQYQPKEKCIGCLSLPLELAVAGGRIKAYPVEEVRHLIGSNGSVTDAYVKETYVNGGEEVYIELTEKPE